MISSRIGVSQLTQIHLVVEAKSGDNLWVSIAISLCLKRIDYTVNLPNLS